jgi:hypothetical protein
VREESKLFYKKKNISYLRGNREMDIVLEGKILLFERKQIILHMEELDDVNRLFVEAEKLLWT